MTACPAVVVAPEQRAAELAFVIQQAPAMPFLAVEGPQFIREDQAPDVQVALQGLAPGAEPTWFEVSAVAEDGNNLVFCGFDRRDTACHAPLSYRVETLETLAGSAQWPLFAVPHLATAGTHHIGVTLGRPPSVMAEEDLGRLLELVVRRDDSYVGFVSELLGLPFVFWPWELPGRGHQTDLRLAADCAAVAIYGQRRLGRQVPYVAPAGLHRLAGLVVRDQRLDDLEPLAVQEGDLLRFGDQSAVLSRDLARPGLLDPEDLVIHAHHGLVEEVAVGDLPYGWRRFDLLRW